MAACLGLDPSQYKSRAPVEAAEDAEAREEDRYSVCKAQSNRIVIMTR